LFAIILSYFLLFRHKSGAKVQIKNEKRKMKSKKIVALAKFL